MFEDSAQKQTWICSASTVCPSLWGVSDMASRLYRNLARVFNYALLIFVFHNVTCSDTLKIPSTKRWYSRDAPKYLATGNKIYFWHYRAIWCNQLHAAKESLETSSYNGSMDQWSGHQQGPSTTTTNLYKAHREVEHVRKVIFLWIYKSRVRRFGWDWHTLCRL